MAGDAHPADGGNDGPVTSPQEGAGRAKPDGDGMTVTGKPTARELTALLAAVHAVCRRRFPTAASSPGGPTGNAAPGRDSRPGSAGPPDGGTDRTGAESTDSRERIAHERRCPVCRERYDSTQPLDGATSVRTAERGASTVCVDPGSNRVYVHSPPPR